MNKIILACLLLTSCSMYRTSTIQNDIENKNKIAEIQQKIDSGIQETINNNIEYKECNNRVQTLQALNNKKSLTKSDVQTIKSMFPNSSLDQILCQDTIKFNKKEYKKEFEHFCHNKYHTPKNGFLNFISFPFVLTNLVVSIATLGILPFVVDGGSGDVTDCENLDNQLNFDIPQGKSFTTEDVKKLDNKIYQYCETNFQTRMKYLQRKQACAEEFTEGCLTSLGISLRVVEKRENGIILEPVGDAFRYATNNRGIQYFIYDTRNYNYGDYYKTDGYLYQYVGDYNDWTEQIPAFKRSTEREFSAFEKKSLIEWDGICDKYVK